MSGYDSKDYEEHPRMLFLPAEPSQLKQNHTFDPNISDLVFVQMFTATKGRMDLPLQDIYDQPQFIYDEFLKEYKVFRMPRSRESLACQAMRKFSELDRIEERELRDWQAQRESEDKPGYWDKETNRPRKIDINLTLSKK